MAEFRMPSLGADMEAGTVIQWLIKPGDAVKRGDIIAVVDTEKADIEVEVFEAGVIESIVVPEGRKVPVGEVLALLQTEGAPVARAQPQVTAPPKIAPPAPSPPPSPRVEMPPRKPSIPAAHRPRVSPLAMRVALDLGMNLSTVTGTGPDGAITKADVERAAKVAAAPPAATSAVTPPAPPAPAVEATKLARTARPAAGLEERQAAMRRVIASAMARSKREVPHYYLGTHIDMSRAMTWLQTENLKRPVTERLLYSVLLLKAVAMAIHQFPEMNGFWSDGAFKPSIAVHLGVAISLRGGGLIAPALHDVDKKTLTEIMANLRDLVNRVRAGVLRSSEIADATITVTSLGEQGVETVYGVIYAPQVALIGFGNLAERPWAANGMVGARPVIAATLSADHRVSDGNRGGRFLATLDRLLQEPEKL